MDTTTHTDAAASEIVEAEKAWAAAIQSRDPQRAGSFLADGYFLAIAVQGLPLQFMPREVWLATLDAYVTEEFSIDDIRVNVYGDVAVALLLFTQKATVRGQDRSGRFLLTDIWVRRADSWQVSERHSSRPEAPRLTPGLTPGMSARTE